MFIPGSLISLLTFPGVIVHEMAHKLFCDITKTPVYEVRYFGLKDPSGYVSHHEPSSLKGAFLISIGPLILNTILCSILTFPAIFPITVLSETQYDFIFLVLFWLGLSIGMHAFPSNEDVQNFLSFLDKERKFGTLYYFAQGFALILKVAHWLKYVWIDLIYALMISMALPSLLGIT